MNQYFSTAVLAALLATSSTLLFSEAIANASIQSTETSTVYESW
jgi:hypothetical protein